MHNTVNAPQLDDAPRGIKLTAEQQLALDYALTGKSLSISARAGTGKTSTLLAIANAMSEKSIAYMAFNRAIADEAKVKFPANVDCVTVHSLAYRAVGYKYKSRLDGKLTPKLITDALRLSPLGDRRTALLIQRTMQRFIKSADDNFDYCHVDEQLLSVILKHADDEALLQRSRDYVLTQAAALFNAMVDTTSALPIDHDFYLKLWQLSKPVLPYNVIMQDEAQDIDPVMLSVIALQTAQVILVGDVFQNLYAWRSTVDALELFKTDCKCVISQSFRFGDAIAAIANKVLHNAATVTGFSDINSKVYHTGNPATPPEPDCIIARTNFGVIGATLEQLDRNKQVYVEGGTKGITYLISGILDLMGKGKSSHPELSMFDSWQDLIEHSETDEGSEYKQIVALTRKYSGRLPMLIAKLKSCAPDSSHADVTVSTCHKAKGKEWRNVRLCNDFKALEFNSDNVITNKAEQCVLYVAVTRAIRTLDVTGVDAIDDLFA